MSTGKEYNYLRHWIENLQANGFNYFTYDMLLENFQGINEGTLKSSLSRLVQKRKVVSVYKGFYLILNVENSRRGILEPVLFIDYLMKYLQRKYYVGLLSAAAYHGASHQQPQEFFVITGFPQIRPTLKRGIKINYIVKTAFPGEFVRELKTSSGYFNLSSPELTAIDLIQYQHYVGGMNRVATVIYELAEAMDPAQFNSSLIKGIPIVYLQRLGYIIDNHSEKQEIANKIHDILKQKVSMLPRQALCPGKPVRGFLTDKKWNLIMNIKIESDL